MQSVRRASALIALAIALILALTVPDTTLAESIHRDFRGRAWLPGEEGIEQTLASQSQGLICPLLWPSYLPATLAWIRQMEAPSPSDQAASAGSFLVEYRSRDGNAFLQLGVYRPSAMPAGASQKLLVRGTLPALLLKGDGRVAGDYWIRWSEPGWWQPAGRSGPTFAAVDYEVHAHGLTESEAEGFVEGLVAIEGPWAYVRGRLPPDVVVLRPTWLPSRFQEAPVPASVGISNGGPYYQVGYRAGPSAAILFILGPSNSAPPDSSERLPIRGAEGLITTSARWWPGEAAYWDEGGRSYAVQATGISRLELLRIVTSLQPVAASACHATAAATPSRLPRSGGIPLPSGLLAGCSALLAGAGVRLRRRGPDLVRPRSLPASCVERESAVGRP